MAAESVPGFTVGALLGFGETGEVWRAVDDGSDERVVLRRLAGDAGVLGSPAAVGRLRAVGARMAALDHPALLPLRRMLALPEGVVLVQPHVPGGSLVALPPSERLGPAAARAVVAIAAEALAAAHAGGLAHGRLDGGDLLLDGRGGLLVSGVGVRDLLGVAMPGAAARDVRGLAAAVVAAARLPGARRDQGSRGDDPGERLAELLLGDSLR